mmetsp:Transcript_4031/g.11666  ORF Transcript_4031/g.11666 Transcript_4031/m.11666 type:complete len:247 (+) Transcript_4031:871-1611(+)
MRARSALTPYPPWIVAWTGCSRGWGAWRCVLHGRGRFGPQIRRYALAADALTSLGSTFEQQPVLFGRSLLTSHPPLGVAWTGSSSGWGVWRCLLRGCGPDGPQIPHGAVAADSSTSVGSTFSQQPALLGRASATSSALRVASWRTCARGGLWSLAGASHAALPDTLGGARSRCRTWRTLQPKAYAGCQAHRFEPCQMPLATRKRSAGGLRPRCRRRQSCSTSATRGTQCARLCWRHGRRAPRPSLR